MSEIEKAREALVAHMLSVQAVDEFLRKLENFSRAIAREEIEANEERLVCEMHGEPNHAEDKSPPAVEAPAAGDCPHCDGSGKAEDVGAGEDDDTFYARILKQNHSGRSRAPTVEMTALARRLAEALNKVWLSGEPEAHEREVESALTEARKAGLIE